MPTQDSDNGGRSRDEVAEVVDDIARRQPLVAKPDASGTHPTTPPPTDAQDSTTDTALGTDPGHHDPHHVGQASDVPSTDDVTTDQDQQAHP